MDSERMPIDFFEKKELIFGNIIGIYGTYYPISYWYIHNIDENLVTLIKLDKNYMPLLLEPELIQIEKHLISYIIISNSVNFTISHSYFQTYYQNRVINKKPRYGDLLHIRNSVNEYEIFRVLNFDPISGSYLCIEGDYSDINKRNYYTRNVSIILNLCDFVVVSTKELRRDILEKSKKITLSLSMCNYERLYRLDDIIDFKYSMNYLSEQSELNHMKLNELRFLYNENNEAQHLEDLIKFESLQLEEEYCPENNDNYKWVDYVLDTNIPSKINIEEYVKLYCPKVNNDENDILNGYLTHYDYDDQNDYDETNTNPIIKYLYNHNNNTKVYDVWKSDNICDNYELDEVFSFNDYRNVVVPYSYNENSSIDSLENDNYIYKDDLIHLYDTDEEADLKNMETFSISYHITDKIPDIYDDNSSDVMEGKSYSTSFEIDDDKHHEIVENLNQSSIETNEEILPILEIIENLNQPSIETHEEILPILEIIENIDEYIKLEKEDFEPFQPERGCSIM